MTTSPEPSADATRTLSGLQVVLAGEHAAVYGYGVGAPRMSAAGEAAARPVYEAHRTRRGQLSDLVVARGATPVAALAGYVLPMAVVDDATARQLFVHLEDRLAALYADLVADAGSPEVRRLAAGWLTEAASRAASWGGALVAFPGLPERPTAAGPPTPAGVPGVPASPAAP